MDRRDFLKTSAAAAVASTILGHEALAQQPATVYNRPLHCVYALQGGKSLTESDATLQSTWSQVTGGITALCPFFLNVPAADLPSYQTMINWAQANNIALIPAVGGPGPGHTLNTAGNQAIAQGYRNLPTRYIRLENLSGFYQNPGGPADVSGFIDYCIGIGFTKIMLNPWPVDASNNLATFTSTQLANIDAAFQNVNPNTWEINTGMVNKIITADSSIRILVNYESPGPQQTIAAMTVPNQEATFQTTLTQLAGLPSTDNLHWCPPFTQSYDPVVEGTWTWIANQLDAFQ
jgi:hypothetical protein